MASVSGDVASVSGDVVSVSGDVASVMACHECDDVAFHLQSLSSYV